MPEDPVRFLDLQAIVGQDEEVAGAVARVVGSGRYIGGPELEAFEAAWAAYCGTGHAVGAGNGLDALTLLLQALGVGPGDEVIVPSWTFIATWLAVSQCGATVVPVEVDPTTGNLDAGLVGAACTPRTRAIVCVHLYGQPADVPAVRAAAGPGVAIVEDAAQAHGAVQGFLNGVHLDIEGRAALHAGHTGLGLANAPHDGVATGRRRGKVDVGKALAATLHRPAEEMVVEINQLVLIGRHNLKHC